MLNILRKQLNQQQFMPLLTDTEAYWFKTKDIQVLPLMALAQANMQQKQKVFETMELIKQHRNDFNVDARADLSAVLVFLGRHDQGELLMKSVLQTQPDHAQALAQLAWCRLREDKKDESVDFFQQSFDSALKQNEIILPVSTNLVKLRVEAEAFEQAQFILDAAISLFKAQFDELSEASVKQQKRLYRNLQFEIWVSQEDFAQVEQWLEDHKEELEEDEWVELMVAWAHMLLGRDKHAQAEESLKLALKQYPENTNVLEVIADVANSQGRLRQAALLLKRAIRCAEKQEQALPKRIQLWCKLSDYYLHKMEGAARKALEKAQECYDQLEVDDKTSDEKETDDKQKQAIPEQQKKHLLSQINTALAKVESEEQNFDVAEKLFKEVLEESPRFLPAIQAYGHQKMLQGDIDQAVELFEQVKAIDPARGFSALINARQFPEDKETLEKLEKVARQPNMMGSINTSMMYQLASAWEKQKDYDKAFGLVQEANENSLKLLKYDPKEHRQRCARIRHAFPKDLYEHRKDCGVQSSLPVYVLGMPRSGTTLVEQILAGHSQICGAGELGVIPQVIAGLERWERHVGSGRNFPDCIDDISPYVSEGIANNVLKELQEFDEEAKHVVDKLPHNFQNIGLIKFLFPKAKIISIRRDPRDIAVSNYFTDYQAKHGGMGFAYDLKNIGEQLSDHNLMMHYWNEIFPGEILEVNYEDVVEDLEGSAKKMLDYIGVDWEEGVLAFNELDRPVKTASVWQVRQPVYKTSKAKWKNYQENLKPLFEGTNAKITWDDIEMLTMPEPGLLSEGVAQYKDEKLDEAEYTFKKLLHHLPEHAAANFMTGLVYVRKGHLKDGIELMEKGFAKCRWNKDWRKDLIQAYELAGEDEKAEKLKPKPRKKKESDSESTEKTDEVLES